MSAPPVRQTSNRLGRIGLGLATVGLVTSALLVHTGNLLGIVLSAAILILLERMYAARRQPMLRQGWRADVVHLVVNRAFSTIVVLGALAGVATTLRAFVPVELTNAVTDQNAWLQFLEAILLVELGSYWSHRMLHAVPFLWRFHSLHHSSMDLDWLSAVRQHPLDLALTHAWTAIPLFVLGFSPSVWGSVFLIGTLQAFFVHANLRLRIGPLRWIVTSPEFHRWHHVDDPIVRDSNYAFAFPVVDKLFGTLHLPGNQRPERFGIGDPPPDSYLRQLALPFTQTKLKRSSRPTVSASSRLHPDMASRSSTWPLIRERNRSGENDSACARISVRSNDSDSKVSITRASTAT